MSIPRRFVVSPGAALLVAMALVDNHATADAPVRRPAACTGVVPATRCAPHGPAPGC